jgi:hypothetical protein
LFAELKIEADQLFWESKEHPTPEYVFLYSVPTEFDVDCKGIANLGHKEKASKTVEHLQEEQEQEQEQKKLATERKKKKRGRKAKGNGKANSTLIENPEVDVSMVDKGEKSGASPEPEDEVIALRAKAKELEAEVGRLNLKYEEFYKGTKHSAELAAKVSKIPCVVVDTHNAIHHCRVCVYSTASDYAQSLMTLETNCTRTIVKLKTTDWSYGTVTWMKNMKGSFVISLQRCFQYSQRTMQTSFARTRSE